MTDKIKYKFMKALLVSAISILLLVSATSSGIRLKDPSGITAGSWEGEKYIIDCEGLLWTVTIGNLQTVCAKCGLIQVPECDLTVTNTTGDIKLYSGTTIIGTGNSSKISNGLHSHKNIFNATNQNNITIIGFNLDGRKDLQSGQNYSMRYPPVPHPGMDVLEVLNNNIFIKNCQDIVIERVRSVNSCNNGILLYSETNRATVSHCFVGGCDWHGIENWNAVLHSNIMNNIVWNCYQHEIVVEISSRDCSILGNNCLGSGTTFNYGNGINVQTTGNNTVVGNTVEWGVINLGGASDCTITGNEIRNGRMTIGTSYRNTISGNKISQFGTVGTAEAIRVQSSYNNINGNTINGAYTTAIRIYSDASYCNIGENTIYCTATTGIGEEASSNYNSIHDNYINSAITTKVSATGANTDVKNNYNYVTDKCGNTSVANNGTISHGLNKLPMYVGVTCENWNMTAQVTQVTATTFKVSLRILATGAAAVGSYNVYWRASAFA